jgi:P4 family phage/plasmid primase-like protien
MTNQPQIVRLFEAGFRPLVCVIPPRAPLAPTSRIPPGKLGKTPGVPLGNGTWVGYHWLKYVPNDADIRRWAQAGASVGILAAGYPALDIDSMDPVLASEIEQLALDILGPAPVRFGQRPKRLLMYRTGEPFARITLFITRDGVERRIEFLGAGNQYLVDGEHPSGARYEWFTASDAPTDLTSYGEKDFTWITRANVEAFFEQLIDLYGEANCRLVGDGKVRERDATPQADLLAPSLDALRAVVDTIPNTDEVVPTRDEYVRVGLAIRAAGGEDAYELFASWCARHPKDQRVSGNPETWREDWGRFHPPYTLGWGWLCDFAAPFGFARATWEFAAEDAPAAPAAVEDERAPEFSELWLADYVISQVGDLLRYAPEQGAWYVWSRGRWARDAMLLADYHVGEVLKRLAVACLRRGATDAERKRLTGLAEKLCSIDKLRNVRQLLRHDPRIAVPITAFDANPWLLSTPAGIVDLRTGELRPPDPNAMCSRITTVAPEFATPSPIWDKFLNDSTAGDIELQLYLQRLLGYGLTGLTDEDALAFVWGEGQNGKSTFLEVVTRIFGDYHERAAMETFLATTYDRHPTELAKLAGARLVTAAETQEGRRWDEQRVKELTGGDEVTARFMRENFFNFWPKFLLLFYGNHRPEIRNLDEAMRRRFHLVPFVHRVPDELKDLHLAGKLKAEYPAILAWMIRGCIEWQRRELAPPSSVQLATAEYFADEDPVGRWIEERCETRSEMAATMVDLFRSWEQWTNANGEYTGSAKRLSLVLAAKRFGRWREPGTGRRGFTGLKPRNELEEVI